MKNNLPNGIWPVMLTPFTENNKIDYVALEKLTSWYIKKGADGLFAVCQSSEMFQLSLKERKEISKFVKECAGQIPVIASGHISDDMDNQIRELNEIAETGVDALILISNRLVKEDQDDDIMLENLDKLISKLPKEIPLGLYECPYPYKRTLTPKILRYCIQNNNFHFIKDTSCDTQKIKEKLNIIKGSELKLYNANTATLLETLEFGASGYSGVMANFHPQLYKWLINNYEIHTKKAVKLQNMLTMCSLIEYSNYPVNAKYMMQKANNGFRLITRKPGCKPLTYAQIQEVDQLDILIKDIQEYFQI